MDVLTDKKFNKFGYICRYSGVPYYFNKQDEKYVYGLMTQVHKDTAYTVHNIKQDDTLASLALRYYNNPTLYWVIAFFNDIQDSFINLFKEGYKTIKIPNISSLTFGDER